YAPGKILIMGAGLLGLSVALVLKREGVAFIMVETIPSRIKRAQEFGLECLHLSQALMGPEYKDFFQCIIDATGDHLGGTGGWKYLEHFGSHKFSGIILAKYIKPVNFQTYRFFSKEASLKWIQGCTEESFKKSINVWKDKIDSLGKVLI